MTKLYLSFLFCWILSTGFAQTGCPACTVALPPLPADTLYLTTVPDGQLAAPYAGELSFRLPKSTTPVAVINPDISPGIDIDEIRIDGLTNLPPGLGWTASQQDYVLDEQTDGCVRLCGVPLDTGLFVMQVKLTASISIIDESVSFGVPIYIGPATSSADGFALTGNVGCGSATVSFENLLPSSGRAGIGYSWDFGDNSGSTLENPPAKTYTAPGVYPVDYRATFDTLGYTLTNVTVEDADCDDIIGQPDLFIELFDPTGALVYTSPTADGQSPPVSFGLSVAIDTGLYTIVVTDDDAFGSDDCGSVQFARSDDPQLIQNGDLTVSLTMVHPVPVVTSTLDVLVYPVPAAPVLNLSALTVCPDEPVLLSGDERPGSYQWFRDTTLLVGADSFELEVREPGRYVLRYYSPDGCAADSDTALIDWHVPPAVPEFSVDNNLLQPNDESFAADGFGFQWYRNGAIISGATEPKYCIVETGTYGLEITDPQTGCTARWDYPVGILYNPDASCTTPVRALADFGGRIFPNPFDAELRVDGLRSGDQVRLLDVHGRLRYAATASAATAHYIPTAALLPGVYFLTGSGPAGTWTRRVVKR